jgi:DNA polymerase-3 subunit delta|tara:strand:+ start:106 stop:1101 length:996 start_codon:yes stop_codon:yes gene_type:complete
MIIKFFEVEKVDLKTKQFFLLYGENQGLKNEIIEKKFKKNYSSNTYNYEENDILNNKENFFNTILSKSFFENEKLIIINRASDKLKEIVEEIIEKNITDLILVLNANILEKKSKLRSLFEKQKQTICVPFYADTNQTLIIVVNNFFKKNKIAISQQAINLMVERCRGDRQNLNNELQKVQSFIKNRSKIEIKDLLKLTNLAENYDVSELIDGCLAKNKKKTINILNENNYSLEDCILIIRTFLIKSKRLLKLSQSYIEKNNIDEVISSFKPPIFWKDKEIIKQQIKNWSHGNIENLIFKINEIELLIKKNSNNSINILSDFIIEQATNSNN